MCIYILTIKKLNESTLLPTALFEIWAVSSTFPTTATTNISHTHTQIGINLILILVSAHCAHQWIQKAWLKAWKCLRYNG